MSRIPNHEMADELNKLVIGKATWLQDFSEGRRKRPEHEIETRWRELAVLKQAVSDYSAAADRDGGAA
ncbi:hypothetical protein SAMN04515648_4531 [Phyllobacterium sp. CL33Tsu]|uniref:hypothetical protein n=1 Tax=Phyllobacterium sp. CL33Tsu TaxID=1798191 RepID=UPI0008E1BC83|nr:hypothetical protein [Phyllobacterium sp. CL33Tsu]SFJ54648.1 hypothetical protein SAMN04515648_4531 [Phyllobacterium sp. CL33Tsu]